MSAFGAAIARAVTSLGGPGTAAALVAGGLAIGAVGGGFAASRAAQPQAAGSSDTLAVYACPGAGEPLVVVRAGQKLLATGRTEDSGWLRIHFPEPGRTEAWVQAAPLRVDGSVAGLPVATCAAELAIAAPSLRPTVALTVPEDNPPSPSSTASAPPSGAPTPSPTAKPAVAALTASTRQVSYDTGSYCPSAAKRVTFRVRATDAAGVDGVMLFWREPGATTYAQAPMSRAAGSATSGTWQVTLDTAANGITKAGRLAYYAVATNVGGATAKIPGSGAGTVTVAVCANTGPTITSASSSSGSSLSWNPLGAPGSCQTATNLTAAVKDVDGVRSVTLFYRRPGSSGYQSKAMNNRTIPGRWYANLDTLGDRISVTSPPTDTLRWFIRAVDAKNKTSQSKTGSITVRRCDTEATFFVNSLRTTQISYGCPSNSVQLQWDFSVTDRDDPNGAVVRATLSYRLVNDTTGRSRTEKRSVRVTSQRFSIASGAFDGPTFQLSNSVNWTITTYDRYGGSSSSQSKGTVYMNVC